MRKTWILFVKALAAPDAHTRAFEALNSASHACRAKASSTTPTEICSVASGSRTTPPATASSCTQTTTSARP
eukprot:3792846-Pleurochrysis_carterae.AAC.1